MANWAEGTLKIRGKKENIESALRYMFQNYEQTINDEFDYIINFTSNEHYLYIYGTERAFIKDNNIEVNLYDDFLSIEIDKFKQEWKVSSNDYKEISSKFNVDIRIFAFEMGMQFTQEIEILKGDIIKDIVHKYDDYTWEVPFSNLGG